MFWDCLIDWALPGLTTVVQALAEAGATSASMAQYNAALIHALKRGLTWPQKSSIYRNLMKGSAGWEAAAGAMAPAILALGVTTCLYGEMNALAQGQCVP
jgi:hypothetical protein